MPRVVPTSQLEVESIGSANEVNNLSNKKYLQQTNDNTIPPKQEKTHTKTVFLTKDLKENELPDLFEDPLNTGRNFPIDCFMSIKMITIIMSLTQLFATCLIIWATTIIIIKTEVSVDISIISIIIWVTFAVMTVLSIIIVIVLYQLLLKKPIMEITLQLFKMKKIKFDDIKRMPTLLAEFIPLFSLFWEFTKTMKEIRPFIPESLLPVEEDEDIEKDRLAEEQRERQLIEMRKLLNNRKQISKTSLVSSIDGSLKSSNAPSIRSKLSSVSTAATQKVSLDLGLTSYVATVLVIQFRNFDARSFPIATDLLGVFTMLYQKVQSVSKQFKGRATILTPKVIMVNFENGRNFEKGALMCAVQLKKQMLAVNSQLKDQVKLPELDFGIGISRSECLVGNIGTSQVKYFSLIGECASNALKLASLNATLGTRVLTDESMTNALLSDFVFRPVAFSKRSTVLGDDITFDLDGKTTQTIIELIGEDKVDDDEWLYELQQKEDSHKYDKFSEAFEILKSHTITTDMLLSVLEVLKEYTKDQKDVAAHTLFNQLSPLLNLNNGQLRERMKNFSIEEHGINLHIDPTFVL